jgi:hypothetical protein
MLEATISFPREQEDVNPGPTVPQYWLAMTQKLRQLAEEPKRLIASYFGKNDFGG